MSSSPRPKGPSAQPVGLAAQFHSRVFLSPLQPLEDLTCQPLSESVCTVSLTGHQASAMELLTTEKWITLFLGRRKTVLAETRVHIKKKRRSNRGKNKTLFPFFFLFYFSLIFHTLTWTRGACWTNYDTVSSQSKARCFTFRPLFCRVLGPYPKLPK